MSFFNHLHRNAITQGASKRKGYTFMQVMAEYKLTVCTSAQ